ncbi:hypothetical protein BKA62DRAFT_768278 [Auriculariales sp. MPI-PUGE-AT-0066]|nr:hypothetical protein BKA62DRAFT_768278 [Auriculariales sp. MPI-PUGE-AT-0066]
MSGSDPALVLDRKRKRPPTFVHLPQDRAKKLKREWVETKKIKAQWRIEKKRMGAATPARADEDAEDEEWQGITLPNDDAADNEDGPSGIEQQDSDDGAEQPVSAPAPQQKTRHDIRPQPSSKRNMKERERAEKLRQLGREAYASSSLHHFRSDPLGRRRGQQQQHGGTRGNGRGRGEELDEEADNRIWG